jgi:hypothetical protein
LTLFLERKRVVVATEEAACRAVKRMPERPPGNRMEGRFHSTNPARAMVQRREERGKECGGR